MPRCVLHAIRLADDAVRVDEIRPALRPLGKLLLRRPHGFVDPAYVPVDIRQQPEWKVVRVGEGLVLLGRIEGDSNDRCVECFELWDSITESLSFRRSPTRQRLGIPPQNNPAAALLFERDRLPVLIRQRKSRRRNAFR